MTLQPGTTFGPYEILAALGAGGMGEVYRARDTRLGREVALKVLSASSFGNPVRRARFVKEAQTAGGLNHPNLAAVYDVNLESSTPYIVSELVPGISLRALIERGPVPLNQFLNVAVQIAFGLATAHKAGVVHRDLKPENILITPEGVVKIIDFGIAKSHFGDPVDVSPEALTLTTEGGVVGTVSYMSPEQACGREIDHRSDIFSLGLVLHEMITGQHAFPRATAVEQLAAILREEPAAIEQPVPNSVLLLVARCLAKESSERYQSTQDLYLTLRDLRDNPAERSTGTARRVTSKSPRASRLKRWLIPVACGLGGILLAAACIDPAATNQPPPRFTPLATGPELEDSPDWSPGGDAVSYNSTVDGVKQIFVLGLNSASPVQITHCPADCESPRWSADGGRIYFRTRGSIAVVGAAGGEPQTVLQNGLEFELSRDGRTMVFRRSESSPPGFSIWLSSPPGAEPRHYAPAPFEGHSLGGRIFLSFSPDNHSILFWANIPDVGRGPEMWLLPLPPGSPRRVLTPLLSPLLMRGMSWMPDGRNLVIASTAGSDTFRTHLQMLDTRTGAIHQLVNTTGIESSPSVSRDGTRLGYATLGIDIDVVEIPLDGSPVRPAISTSRLERSPAWHPTLGEFAYITDRRGTEEIWIHTVSPRRDRPVVAQSNFPGGQSAFLNSPAFSPDGERLAFARGGSLLPTSQRVEIWVAGVAGGALARLTNEQGGNQWAPTWSPDGNYIAFFESTSRRVMKARVGAAAAPEPLMDCARPGECLAEWSPKGDWIAVKVDARGTLLVSPDGTRQRVLRPTPYLAMAWKHDGSALIGLALEQGRLRIYSMDVATGTEKLIDTLPADITFDAMYSSGVRVSLSPDGKSLLAARRSYSSDLWMLERFHTDSTAWTRLRDFPRSLLDVMR